MALFPLQPGVQPLGQYDVLDTELSSILGGEVMTLTQVSRSNTATELAAFDAADGYLFDASAPIQNRPASVRASSASQFPLFLSDDGFAGYGTLFGSVIGTPAGLSTSGSNLGPSTAAASGKVTLWDKPGLYAVSTDAVASDFITSIAVGAGAGLSPGRALGFTSTGKLAHSSCSGAVSSSGVAYFVEFESAPTSNSMASLVTTPGRLVGATEIFNRVVLSFHAGYSLRTL